MRTRTMLRAVSLGVVVVATLLALVAPAAAGTAAGSAENSPYRYAVAGIETFWGYQPPGSEDENEHAGVRFRGTFFSGATTQETDWLKGKGTVLVVVDYYGTPSYGTTAQIQDTDGDLKAGFVRAWIPVGWCYAFKTSVIEKGTVQWPEEHENLDGCPTDVGKVAVTMRADDGKPPFFTAFTGCLNDANFLNTGDLFPLPKIWGYLESPTPPTALRCGFAAPPTESELEPGFRIEQGSLFLPLIQAPGD